MTVKQGPDSVISPHILLWLLLTYQYPWTSLSNALKQSNSRPQTECGCPAFHDPSLSIPEPRLATYAFDMLTFPHILFPINGNKNIPFYDCRFR